VKRLMLVAAAGEGGGGFVQYGTLAAEGATVLSSNEAWSGGIELSWPHGAIHLELVDSAVLENDTAGLSGWALCSDLVTSVNTDWGTGATDNTVDIGGVAADYGAGASFECTCSDHDITCTP
jgi:hypothetical protein